MHYRMLVFCKEPHPWTSQEARRYVYSHLCEEGFIADGRWACGIADWFVIGGRWSGELTLLSQDKETVKRWSETVDKGKLHLIRGEGEERKKRDERIWELWLETFPHLAHLVTPFLRDTYLDEGYEDDAMIVTEELWERILADAKKEWQGSVIEGTDVIENQDHYVDLDYDDICKEKTVGKWVVVVDYHN